MSFTVNKSFYRFNKYEKGAFQGFTLEMLKNAEGLPELYHKKVI